MGTFRKKLAMQKRVIAALILREIQAQHGRDNLAFAWVFAEPLVFALPVLYMWTAMRGSIERGVPFLQLIWSGYMGILLFRHGAGHAIGFARSSAPLFYHRQVTIFDAFVARMTVEVLGNYAAVISSFLVIHLVSVHMPLPYDLGWVILGWFYMTWWTISVALIIGALYERNELVAKIWAPISYIYMPLSGGWFCAVWLPPALRNAALTVMPSIHAYEMVRRGLFGNKIPTFFNIGYVSVVLAVLTLVGLLLMRDTRKYLVLK
jgi:capsular polysaccharide transport system permease protein